MKVKDYIETLKTLDQEKEIFTFWNGYICEALVGETEGVYYINWDKTTEEKL